jgi:hypothetical protein
MADILTDAIRAQILRILGYRTDVVEFIDSSHTPKNVLIRARKTGQTNASKAALEYKHLVQACHVQPKIEEFLKSELQSVLAG